MSMSDCPRCWETPCSCGYEYEDWDKNRLIEMRDMLDKIIKGKEDKKPIRLRGEKLLNLVKD